MQTSETINELAAAFAKAQAEMKPAAMNAVNPFLHNHYADLGAVIEAGRLALTKNGLSFIQPAEVEGGQIQVTTRLMHASGQWIESTIGAVIEDKKGLSIVQNIGVTITYLRRYALSALLGIYADADQDGNEGDGGNGKQPAKVEYHGKAEVVIKNPQPTTAQGMSIEEAEAEFSQTYSQPYGSIETEALANMANAIRKSKKELTEDQRRKSLAVDVILAARKTGRPVQGYAPELAEADKEEIPFS